MEEVEGDVVDGDGDGGAEGGDEGEADEVECGGEHGLGFLSDRMWSRQ